MAKQDKKKKKGVNARKGPTPSKPQPEPKAPSDPYTPREFFGKEDDLDDFLEQIKTADSLANTSVQGLEILCRYSGFGKSVNTLHQRVMDTLLDAGDPIQKPNETLRCLLALTPDLSAANRQAAFRRVIEGANLLKDADAKERFASRINHFLVQAGHEVRFGDGLTSRRLVIKYGRAKADRGNRTGSFFWNAYKTRTGRGLSNDIELVPIRPEDA